MEPRDGYRERLRWPFWFHLLFAAFLVLNLVVVGAVARDADAPVAAWLVPVFMAAAVGYVWWRVRWLDTRFDSAGAAFGFGGLRRDVPRERIRGARVEDYSFAKYMGWGYRFGWQRPRDRAYSMPGCPRGVRLEFEDARGRMWSIHLSSRDPDAAVAALNTESAA